MITSASGTGSLIDATLGLVMAQEDGTIGIVTAGHGTGTVGSGVWITEQDRIGTVSINRFREPGSNSDIAFIALDPGVDYYDIWGVQGTLVSYSVNAFAEPQNGQEVTMQGTISGASTGTIVYASADVTDPSTGQQLFDVAVASYTSASIDSGAPVMIIDGDTVTLVGFHGGKFLSGGNWYAWLEKIENVANTLELQV